MTNTRADELMERIKQDMRQAMKDRNRTRLDVLRSLSARLSNTEAVDAQTEASTMGIGVGSTELERRQLTLEEVRNVILAELHEVEAALDGIDESSSYAADLRQKAAIIREYIT